MIIAYTPNYVPHYNAGDTLMLHAIVKTLGATVMLNRAIEPYEYDGVKVIGRSASMLSKADLVLCHLDTTKEAIQLGKRVIWIMHNTFPYPSVKENPNVGVIFNAEHARHLFPNEGFVLPPPVDPDYYMVEKGDCITLINCNENKGGKIFYEIAKSMPDRKFLAVKGSYGEQFLPVSSTKFHINLDNKPMITGLGELPNVEVIENQSDIREVYKRTRILLMPSLYESWGRVATEAMCSGIPVIATKTEGLYENIGENGIFVTNRDDVAEWVENIKKLDGKKEYSEASDYAHKRARHHDPKKKLEELKAWVKEFTHKKKSERGLQ